MFSLSTDSPIPRASWAVGVSGPASGLKGDKYIIEMTDYGWTCDCPCLKGKTLKALKKTG